MKLVYPEFLLALLATGIPIIVHLFNLRKFKRISFTNVRFLHNIQQETKSRSKLKHLLVLAARILAIIFIVLAFTQPYIPSGKELSDNKGKVIGIYIDNSFSMEALHKNGTLLEAAKQKAKEIANSFGPDGQFMLLTNDFEAKHQHLLTKEELQVQLNEIQSSPQVKKLSVVVSRLNEMSDYLKNSKKNGLIFLLSDFQRTATDIDQIRVDTSFKFYFIPVTAQQQNNLFIDSCWFSTPAQQLNQTLELSVRIQNNSNNAITGSPLKLWVNGAQKALGSVDVKSNVSTIVKLSFQLTTPGWQKAVLTLRDHPITFDDTFFLSFLIQKELPVLCINGATENKFLQAVYAKDPFFKMINTSESQLDYSGFSKTKLIVLNEVRNLSSGLSHELEQFLRKGGSLMFFPNAKGDINSYNDFFQSLGINKIKDLLTDETKIEKLNHSNILFHTVFENQAEVDNMDFPVVHQYFSFEKAGRTNSELILTLQNNASFLSKYTYQKGNIYIFAAPLNPAFSNFCKHAIAVPTLYNIALFSVNSAPLSYNIGKAQAIPLQEDAYTGDNIYHLTKENFDIIPESKSSLSGNVILLHNQVRTSGNYRLINANKETASLSFNYDRMESDLNCFNVKDLENLIKKNHLTNVQIIDTGFHDLGPTLNTIYQGNRLWKICIILALLFLAIEVVLLRFLKAPVAQSKKQ
jgi:hypothetical protein